jgi:hypothetical protein
MLDSRCILRDNRGLLKTLVTGNIRLIPMPYKDVNVRKKKAQEYSRKHYEANREEVIGRSAKQRQTGKKKWDEYKKSLKCEKCGFFHIAALDFHHINPEEKEDSISNLISNKRFAKAYEELKKCIVLCANCHRIHHYEENVAAQQNVSYTTQNLIKTNYEKH